MSEVFLVILVSLTVTISKTLFVHFKRYSISSKFLLNKHAFEMGIVIYFFHEILKFEIILLHYIAYIYVDYIILPILYCNYIAYIYVDLLHLYEMGIVIYFFHEILKFEIGQCHNNVTPFPGSFFCSG